MGRDPSIPETQLFKIMAKKIQGQGHGRGQMSSSYSESNNLCIHMPFIPWQQICYKQLSIFNIKDAVIIILLIATYLWCQQSSSMKTMDRKLTWK